MMEEESNGICIIIQNVAVSFTENLLPSFLAFKVMFHSPWRIQAH